MENENEEDKNNIKDVKVENKEKPLDKKQILQDKLKKIFLDREQNKYKYNKINIPDNLKYSSDNSNNSSKEKNIKKTEDEEENKDKDVVNNVIQNKNKDLNDKENIVLNNDNNNDEKNNEEKNNNEKNNDENNKDDKNKEEKNNNINNNLKQPSKNYVIKRPPERKKNRANEEEPKNKNINSALLNNRKNNINISKKEEEENNNNDNALTEKENQEEIKDKINTKTNIISEQKEKEEEKNKLLYRQLMAKKCHDVIKLENEKREENLIVNNIKTIKEEKEKEIPLTPIVKLENEDIKRSKTINNNRIQDISNTKESTLKILQLIKAKKNEKNIIDKKMKETKDNINKDNSNIDNIDNNNNEKQVNNLTLEPKEVQNKITKVDKVDDDNQIKEENNNINNKNENKNEKEKEIKENNNTINNTINNNNNNDSANKSDKNNTLNKIQIYKKFKGKGKSCLIGNSNNFIPIKNTIEKDQIERKGTIQVQPKAEKTKIIVRNKINRHHTSLNVTKKNYIIKPKQLNLNHEENNINNLNNIINNNNNINNNNYEKIKTFQNNKIINKFKKNNLYEPKKGLISNNNKIYDERSLNLNMENKSPKKLYGEKLTYVKKSLLGNSNKQNSGHKLNNSLGYITPFINDNYNIENNLNTQIDYNKYNNSNLNNSFKVTKELGKTYYNIGNIFNLDNFEDDNNINLSNNFNINFNLDSLYNINYPFNKNKIKPSTGYNTFYSNNYFPENNNIFNKGENNYNINNINNNHNLNNNNKKVKINNIYNQYRNSNINKGIKKIYENRINKSMKIKNNFSYNNKNLFDTLKFEDLLILEDKLVNIQYSLNEEKIISNDCFEFWNYFFNNSLYENLNIFFSNYDNEYRTMFKMSLNYILMSIILSYDISFDKKIFDKIRPLLLEMLEFSYKLLLNIYEYILNLIPYTNNNINIWIKKLSNLIQKSKSSDESDSFFIETEKTPEKERLNLNINFLAKKIYYILINYPSKNKNKYIINFFKKIQEKNLEEINIFFLDKIYHEKDIKYSILSYTFLKSNVNIPPSPPPPFLNFTKIKKTKKYFLICDIDETLFHFKITEEDEEQGILKIRPGVFQFIEEIKNYYEIILFSEADKDYIDVIIDAIENKRYLYDYILCRDYISIEGNNFIKDLNKIATPLNKTIIIDNMPQNFRKHKDNAIYIKSFFGEENDDKALIDLIPILVNIAKSGKDVRNELNKYKENIVNKISSNIFKHNN